MNIHSLQSTLTGDAAMSADNPKLKSAAHEFEASLMQELLKPLQEDPLFASANGDDLGGDNEDQGSSGALMSFGSEAMAKAISEHGGFGIATKILDHFRATQKSTPTVNGSNI
ncbi:MAG: hypothetical protein ACRD3F_04955 [Acidobacteriaceae bacterium]